MTRQKKFVADQLQRLLKDRKATQNELADRIGLSRVTVKLLMNGRSRLTADVALRLARVFQFPVSTLLELQWTVDMLDADEANRAQIMKIKAFDAK